MCSDPHLKRDLISVQLKILEGSGYAFSWHFKGLGTCSARCLFRGVSFLNQTQFSASERRTLAPYTFLSFTHTRVRAALSADANRKASALQNRARQPFIADVAGSGPLARRCTSRRPRGRLPGREVGSGCCPWGEGHGSGAAQARSWTACRC